VPELYGLIGGLVVASSISSIIFLAWLRRSCGRPSATRLQWTPRYA